MRYAILALVMMLAVGGGYVALNMVGQPEPAQQTPVQAAPAVQINAIDIVVAKQPITLGTVITPDMVDRQPWPEHLMLEHFIRADDETAKVSGMVARGEFTKGEPITLAKLGNPNDGNFLAAALSPGMRAITISVDAISGIAGYVFPGDRVDVLLTHSFIGGAGKNQVPVKNITVGAPKTETELTGAKAAADLFGQTADKPALTEVLIESAKVLVVNLREGASQETKPANTAPTSVTIEVTPEQVQKVMLAGKNGTLSLSLRPITKDQEHAPAPTTLKDISNFGSGKGESITIIRGSGEKNSGGAL